MTTTQRLAALLACLALPAGAQTAPAPDEGGPAPSCAVTARSDILRIAVCDGPGTDAQLAAFGRAACEGALPCGTWFWTSAADAPTVAPANHDGLTQAQVTSSRGVFVAEQDMFVRIEKVAK